MANTKSAKKRARQTPRKTAKNNRIRSRVRTALGNAREALVQKAKGSEEFLQAAISQLTKAANKGVIHKKNASRRISRLMKLSKVAATTVAPVAKAKKSATKAKSSRAKA